MTKKGKGYQEPSPTLHVTGRGEIQAPADIARINLSVVTQASTAQEAAESNAEQMQRVIAAVRELGVSDDQLRTVGLTIYPLYVYPKDQEPQIVGYRAENAVEVIVPVELAGRIYDRGVAAGANVASALSFGLRDERFYRERALLAAMEAAREDAAVVCVAACVELGSPIEIYVEDEHRGPIFLSRAAAADTPQTPVLPGLVTVTASVRVVFSFT